MAKSSVRLLGCALVVVASLAAGVAFAQEKAQKGVSAGALERHTQTQGQDLLSVQQQLKRRDDARPALSPQQMTDLFLSLDHDADVRLTRSERESLPALRARFATFDLDGHHRLTYRSLPITPAPPWASLPRARADRLARRRPPLSREVPT